MFAPYDDSLVKIGVQFPEDGKYSRFAGSSFSNGDHVTLSLSRDKGNGEYVIKITTPDRFSVRQGRHKSRTNLSATGGRIQEEIVTGKVPGLSGGDVFEFDDYTSVFVQGNQANATSYMATLAKRFQKWDGLEEIGRSSVRPDFYMWTPHPDVATAPRAPRKPPKPPVGEVIRHTKN